MLYVMMGFEGISSSLLSVLILEKAEMTRAFKIPGLDNFRKHCQYGQQVAERAKAFKFL